MKRKRKVKRFPKEEAMRYHANKRFLQRLGWIPTKDDYKHIIRMIQTGVAEFVDRSSLRVSRWRVKYRDDEFIVVYDRNRKLIVTTYKEEHESEKSLVS